MIEHLESFVGVVELLVELAAERGFTVVLSVPNDAFWPIESPWHKTMWGEGAFEELRRLLPAEHVVAHQVPLQGSAIVPEGARRRSSRPASSRATDAVPSHFLAAFGPRCRELGARSRGRARPTSPRSAAGSASARPTSPSTRTASSGRRASSARGATT